MRRCYHVYFGVLKLWAFHEPNTRMQWFARAYMYTGARYAVALSDVRPLVSWSADKR